MKNTKIFVVFILASFFVHCKRSSTIKSAEDCQSIPDPGAGVGYFYLYDSLQPSYEAPYFNPNNPEEIVFVSKDFYKGIFGLYYFNLNTKEKKLLYDKRLNFQPKWGRNGWILFNGLDNQVYKIKPNGDSLIQLTNEGANFSPEWNYSADKFITNTFLSNKYIMRQFTTNGIRMSDLLNCGGSNGCWQHDSLICYLNEGCLSIIDPLRSNSTILKMQNISSGGVFWKKNDEILYTTNEGMFIYNMTSNNEKKVKEACESKYYVFLCYSSINNKIIANKVELSVIDQGTLFVKSYLVTMDADGNNETAVLIP